MYILKPLDYWFLLLAAEYMGNGKISGTILYVLSYLLKKLGKKLNDASKHL